jgi:uncharacterized membrane protein
MTTPKERMDFLDIVKGIACVWMIHRHVWNGLISKDAAIPSYYPDFMQGLSAPCFLIGAGLIFIILFESAKKKNEIRKRMKRLLYRCGQVILLGYALQVPYFSLRRVLFSISPDQKLFLYQANVLQCIGLSLILLALFIWALKRFDTLLCGYIAAIVGIGIIWATPWMDAHAHLPTFINSYFTFHQKYTIFPLFPFAGILFFGAATGSFYLHMKARNKVTLSFIIMTALGVLLMLTRPVSFLQNPFLQYGNANPWANLYKIGEGLLALGISYALEKLTGFLKRFVDLLTLMGKEALFVYAFHLALVYGCPLNKGLYSSFASSLSYPSVLLVGLLILLITLIFTWLWSEFKKHWLLGVRLLLTLAFLLFIVGA